MSIEDYMTQTIVIKRTTPTKSTMGSMVDSWVTHLTILGRIRPLKGSEVIRHGKTEVDSDYVLYCKVADIQEKDRAEYDDESYDVIFVRNPMEMDRFLEIDLKKVT